MLTAARARLSPRLRLWLIVGGCVVVLGGAFLWVLPEIVRRTVVTQIPKLTARAASIEDIDLNLFTGRLALKKLRLAEREPSETFLQAERIDLRVSPLSLVVGHVRLADLTLTAPRVRIVRTGPVEFNFSDLLALIPPADPTKPKSRWTISIGRLGVALEVVLERGEDRLTRATVSGDIRIEGVALAQPGRPAPFVKLSRVTVSIKEADLLAQSVTLKSVEAEGLDLRAVRDQAGNIDLLALAGGPTDGTPARSEATRGSAAPSDPRPATGAALPFKAKLERLTLGSASVTLSDQAVTPAREWRLDEVRGAGPGLSP